MSISPAELCRTRDIRLRMVGSNCECCGGKHFPPRDICPDCGYIEGETAQRLKGMAEKQKGITTGITARVSTGSSKTSEDGNNGWH